MFKCNTCGKTTKAGEPATRRVVETREKVYPKRSYANDPGGKGCETVYEVVECEACTSLHANS